MILSASAYGADGQPVTAPTTTVTTSVTPSSTPSAAPSPGPSAGPAPTFAIPATGPEPSSLGSCSLLTAGQLTELGLPDAAMAPHDGPGLFDMCVWQALEGTKG